MSKKLHETIKTMAELARLEIDEAALQKYSDNVKKILEHFEKLNELDTKDIEPTSHTIDSTSRLREDDIVIFKSAGDITKLFPETDGPFVQVPKVI